jgi:hypothetical protein
MRSHLHAALFIAISLAAIACGDRDSQIINDDAGQGTCTLAQDGAACQVNADCCSSICGADDRCAPTPAGCDPVSTACASGATCCSGRCGDVGGGVFQCAAGTASCQPLGQACATAADCCSLGCDNNVCVETICQIGGDGCADDQDCCSNECGPASTCVAGGACLTAGEDCSSGGDNACCSQNCVDAGNGQRRCSAGGSCRTEGEVCTDNGDCCNFSCDAGHCRVISENNPGGCAPAGEVCEGGFSECCPGMPDGREYCLPTDLGVDRCFVTGMCAVEGDSCQNGSDCCSGVCTNNVCGALVCIPDGQPCAFTDQCCNGVCVPDVNGNLVCNPNCVPDLGACTTDADCCGGYCDIQTQTCGIPIP